MCNAPSVLRSRSPNPTLRPISIKDHRPGRNRDLTPSSPAQRPTRRRREAHQPRARSSDDALGHESKYPIAL